MLLCQPKKISEIFASEPRLNGVGSTPMTEADGVAQPNCRNLMGLVLLTRPQVDSEKIQHRLTAMGIRSIIEPLLTMVTKIPSPSEISHALKAPAILFTSKNALPAMTGFLELQSKTVYCVGNATAITAKQHGFQHIDFIAPTVQALLKNITTPVYYFRGEHITQPLPTALLIGESIVYNAIATQNMSAQTLTHIKDASITAVGLWSARTAEIFATLMLQHNLQTHMPSLTLFCLSQTTATAHPLLAQAKCVISARPDTESLLQTILATGE